MSILDIKSGVPIRWHGIQLSGYKYLYSEFLKNPDAKIDFDHSNHIYKVNGQEFEAVSRILEGCGIIDKTWFKPEYAERGTNIHEYTQAIDENILSIDDFKDNELLGYIESYVRWKKIYKPVYSGIEKIVYSLQLKIAGTIDRILDDKKDLLYCLYLKKDGAIAELKPYDNVKDMQTFFSAANIHNWKVNK